MICQPAKIFALFLAAILVLPGPALACTGLQNCAMPCCQSSAGSFGQSSQGVGAQPGCCQVPEETVTQCNGPGQNPAAYSGGNFIQAPSLYSCGQIHADIDPPSCCKYLEDTRKHIPQKVPLYLKILSLLI